MPESQTDLDRAHAAMTASPEDAAARLAYYHRFADTELFLLLQSEPASDRIDPALYDLEDGRFVLAFDSEERLAAFSDAPAAYAALPGRVIAAELAGQGVGIGVNLGAAASAFLMPPRAIDWLADALGRAPVAGAGRPQAYFAPSLPGLADALADKLAGLGALTLGVWISGALHGDHRRGHVLVFEDANPAAEAALAKAAAEAILFSGAEAEAIEILFLSSAQIASEGLADLAVRIAVSAPVPVMAERPAPAAPGSDPAKPPILR